MEQAKVIPPGLHWKTNQQLDLVTRETDCCVNMDFQGTNLSVLGERGGVLGSLLGSCLNGLWSATETS